LIIDEICDRGSTLIMAKQEIAHLGASEIRSAVLYSHQQRTDIPDCIGIITDTLILNPWDREILKEGRFSLHPEYIHAIKQQGIEPYEALILQSEVFPIAKENNSTS
jgi:hypoxanthine phosphoribosyltransferase